MIKIAFPAYPFRINRAKDKATIFDEIRRRWVVLTPEEWVRQNFLQYLIQVKKYPASLIAVEKEMKLGELVKRGDIVIYNPSAQPILMVECKAMDIALDSGTADQILRYNISIPVKYLVITNGSYCFAFERKEKEFLSLDDIPEWKKG
ncbi:MAG: type I restriction enzyme HsdR N-terminal domain-containing protein [Chitinophagaceae bacterium]|nr:type I restriction enzyme HsdR N-terminal domain-containing protein [Chitinophagaceae bacterium]